MIPSEEKDPQTYAIIGAAMVVHAELGCGFLEPVYQEAMQIELDSQGILNRPQAELLLTYKGKLMKTFYKPDFICFESVIVEIKALDRLGGIESAQIINYLKATGLKRGLLINFGAQRLEYKRFVR